MAFAGMHPLFEPDDPVALYADRMVEWLGARSGALKHNERGPKRRARPRPLSVAYSDSYAVVLHFP